MESIIEVARLDVMQNIEFVLCGEGPARNALVAEAQGMSNMRFLPLQPTERLNDLLNLADIHLLPQKAGVEDLVLPSKLGGMLASGRPIVAWANQGTAIAAAIRGCGVAVPPGDISALGDELSQLAMDHEKRREWGLAARKRAVDELGVIEIHRSYEEVLAAGCTSRTAPPYVTATNLNDDPAEEQEKQPIS